MSHREEFEKMLDVLAAAAYCENRPHERAARAEVLRLYDEKPPARSELEGGCAIGVGRGRGQHGRPPKSSPAT